MAQQITIDIVAETQKLRKGIDEVNGKVGSIQKTADNVNKITGSLVGIGAAAQGLGAVGGFFNGAVDSASDLGESLNAVNVAFGDSADEILKLSEAAATGVGLSRTEFNAAATQFSAFANTIAGDGGDVAGTVDDITKRAADFASVYNLDVDDALAKFQSGLAGSSEPLRAFGVDLSAAAVEAYAVEAGIIAEGEALTEAQKVQARYGALLEQTSKTQGDFANTSDSLANTQRIAAAEQANLSAELGETFLPVMTELNKILRVAIGAFSSLPGPVKSGIVIFGLLAATIGPLILLVSSVVSAFSVIGPVLKGFSVATKVAAGAQAVFNAVMAANPIVLVTLAIAALVAGLVYFFTQTELGQEIWGKFTEFVSKTAKAVGEFLVDTFKNIGQFITDTIENIQKVAETVWKAILAVTKFIFNAIRSYFKTVFKVYETIFTNVVNFIKDVIEKGWNFLKDTTRRIFNTIKDIFSNIWGSIKNIVKGVVDNIVSFFGQIPGKIVSVGRDIVEGLWKGIKGAFNWFKDKIFGFFGSIMPGWIKDVLGIRSPSKLFEDIGINVTDGFVKGLGFEDLKNISQDFARAVVPSISDTPSLSRGGAVQSPINVTINAGLGTDPIELGRQVNDALGRYGQVSRRI